LTIHEDFVAGKRNQPYAVKTKLGWVLMGGKNTRNYTMNNFIQTSTESLNLERLWDIESYATKAKNDPTYMTKDEKSALSILTNSTSIVNNQYEISLLWKDQNPVLPCNKKLAERDSIR